MIIIIISIFLFIFLIYRFTKKIEKFNNITLPNINKKNYIQKNNGIINDHPAKETNELLKEINIIIIKSE